MRLRGAFRRFPVRWIVIVAIGLEILLIPVFLLTGADAVIAEALDRLGLAFNTDLITAARVVLAEPAAAVPVLLSLAQVASPDLALLVVVGLGMGAAGLRPVRERLRFWHPEVGAARGLRVWGSAVAVFCAMNLASGWLHRRTFDGGVFEWSAPTTLWALVGGLLVAMFLDAGALFEESAWRGFCLPHLQLRHSPLRASVLLGLAWALWHVPVKFGIVLDYGPVQGAALFGVLTVKFVLLSIVMTHFVNRVGYSTLLAIALHGLSNDSLRLGGLVDATTWAQDVRTELNLIVPMAVVALVLVVRTRGRLGIDDVRDAPVATVGAR